MDVLIDNMPLGLEQQDRCSDQKERREHTTEWIGIVAGIFVLGQFLEGNFVTPKLVGDSVGLHPLWLIFALSAFGTLFGFVGMLVAVPVAAVIGVVARFFIDQYLQGALYRGQTEREPTAHSPISLINEETGEVTGATETTEHES